MANKLAGETVADGKDSIQLDCAIYCVGAPYSDPPKSVPRAKKQQPTWQPGHWVRYIVAG